jgi:hypothetical protein
LQESQGAAITYFQEGKFAGLYDRRTPGHTWKYYVDMSTSHERVIDLASNPKERDDFPIDVPSALFREWRALVLPTARGVSH